MKKEFIDFLNTKEIQPPKEIENAIYKNLEKDFSPIKAFNIISKFLFLNFSAGVLTLAVCPQFGLGPLTRGYDVTHFFMEIGTWACALFCAIFYFATAQALTLFILSGREIRWIAQRRYSVLPGLVLASFIALLMIGNSFGSAPHSMAFEMEFQVIWILAGLIVTQGVFNFVSLKIKGINKAVLR